MKKAFLRMDCGLFTGFAFQIYLSFNNSTKITTNPP